MSLNITARDIEYRSRMSDVILEYEILMTLFGDLDSRIEFQIELDFLNAAMLLDIEYPTHGGEL